MGKVTKTTKVDKVTMSCVSSRPAKKKIQQMEPVALKKTALTKIKEGISLVPVAPPKPKQMPNGGQLVAMLPNLNRNEPAREQPQRLQKANDKENVSVQPKQKNSVPIKVYNGCKRIPSQFYMSWTVFFSKEMIYLFVILMFVTNSNYLTMKSCNAAFLNNLFVFFSYLLHTFTSEFVIFWMSCNTTISFNSPILVLCVSFRLVETLNGLVRVITSFSWSAFIHLDSDAKRIIVRIISLTHSTLRSPRLYYLFLFVDFLDIGL